MLRMLTILAFAASAQAADLPPATQDQRQGLAHALALWEIGAFGVNATGSGDLAMSPAADHFEVRLPVRDWLGPTDASSGALDFRATPLPGGAWKIDDLVLPSPLVTIVTPPGAATPLRTEQRFAQQTAHGVIDPSFATPSHGERVIEGWTMDRGPDSAFPGGVLVEVGRLSTTTAWDPERAGPGHAAAVVQLRSTSRAERISVLSRSDHASFVRLDSLTGSVDSHGVDLEATLRHMRAGVGVFSAWRHTAWTPHSAASPAWPVAAAPVSPTLSGEQARAMNETLLAMRQMAGDGKLSFDVRGLHGVSGGVEGGCDSASVVQTIALTPSSGAAALTDWRLTMTADGIASTAAIDRLLPRRVSLTPFMTRLPAAALWQLFDAMARNADSGPAAAKLAGPLLARAGTHFGIERMTVDFGDATVTGHGDLHFVEAKDVAGSAEVEATGFDDLVRRIVASPAKPTVKAVVLFLKGLGEQRGDRTLWHVSFVHGRVMMNGTDLSALAPK